jgi:hypothetical protein
MNRKFVFVFSYSTFSCFGLLYLHCKNFQWMFKQGFPSKIIEGQNLEKYKGLFIWDHQYEEYYLHFKKWKCFKMLNVESLISNVEKLKY